MNVIKNIFGFTIVNAIIFYVASITFGQNVVFGNATTSYLSAIILTAVLVALIATAVNPIAQNFKIKLSPNGWMIVYFLVNSATIYILARTPVSLITAIGISAFWVALILGFVVNLGQYAVWKVLPSKK